MTLCCSCPTTFSSPTPVTAGDDAQTSTMSIHSFTKPMLKVSDFFGNNLAGWHRPLPIFLKWFFEGVPQLGKSSRRAESIRRSKFKQACPKRLCLTAINSSLLRSSRFLMSYKAHGISVLQSANRLLRLEMVETIDLAQPYHRRYIGARRAGIEPTDLPLPIIDSFREER